MATARPLSFLRRNDFLLRRLHSLTGIVPVGLFLVSHLLTNSTVVWGLLDARHRAAVEGIDGHAGVHGFQHEVSFIHGIPFLLLIELSLWASIAFHSLYGVYIIRTGRSNTARYGWWGNVRYTLQRVSAWVGLVFIFYHVATLRWGWTFLVPGGTRWDAGYAASTLAAALQGGAEGKTVWAVPVALGYMIGVSMLVFHMANGLWTAAITWGLTISERAQQRWAYACFGLGAGLMVLAWAAVIGFVTLDVGRARRTEEHYQAHGVPEIPVTPPAVPAGEAGGTGGRAALGAVSP